jgi:cytochrome bd-type quinol oxidase subunit 1
MTEQSTIKTVEYAEPSPVPENNWFWRRMFAFGFTVACFVFAWRLSERVEDIGTLRMALRYSLLGAAMMSLLYMAGASAEAIGRIVAAVRTSRKETVTHASPPTRVKTDQQTVETPPADAETPVQAASEAPPWERKP